MRRINKEFDWNLVVDRIVGILDNMMSNTGIQELLTKENLVMLRSAKENVTHSLLEQLSSSGYAGNLYLIGRQGDEKYISEYSGMNIDLFVIDDSEAYSVENTKAYIDMIQADAVCFLYQLEVSSKHDNLLQIVQYVNCQGYAVSRDTQVVKIDIVKLHDYLRGKAAYDALCDWFYDTK